MARNGSHFILHLSVLAILAALILGCSSSGNGSIPTIPDLDDAPPANVPEQLLGQYVIDPTGGTIDLDWFSIDFPDGSLIEPARVSVYSTRLDRPHDGIVVGGQTLRIVIEPVPDPMAIGHANEQVIVTGASYEVTFDIGKMPIIEGDFSPMNEYIDIYAEWSEFGRTIRGYAWGDVENGTYTYPFELQDLKIALVDYSDIPEG